MAEFILRQLPNGPEHAIAGVMTVGRNEDNTLRLNEPKISRYHARLTRKDACVFVEDLGSSNGTFINDRRIEASKPCELHSGDRLRFDRDEFEVRAPSQDSNRTETRSRESSARPPSWVEDPEGQHTVFIAPPKKRDAARPAAHAATGEPLPGDAPYLLFSSGSKSGSKVELAVTPADRQIWTIGGQSDRDICLTDAGISAMHATLRRQESAWQLTDDLSVNGTFVNDSKILQCFLSDGDRIRFGPLECVFRIPPPGAKVSGAGRGRNLALLVAGAFLATLAVVFLVYEFFF